MCHAILATRKSAVRSLLDFCKGTAFPWRLFWNMFVFFCESNLEFVNHDGLPAQSFRAVPPDKNIQKPNGFFPISLPENTSKDSVSFDTAIAASPIWHASMSLGNPAIDAGNVGG